MKSASILLLSLCFIHVRCVANTCGTDECASDGTESCKFGKSSGSCKITCDTGSTINASPSETEATLIKGLSFTAEDACDAVLAMDKPALDAMTRDRKCDTMLVCPVNHICVITGTDEVSCVSKGNIFRDNFQINGKCYKEPIASPKATQEVKDCTEFQTPEGKLLSVSTVESGVPLKSDNNATWATVVTESPVSTTGNKVLPSSSGSKSSGTDPTSDNKITKKSETSGTSGSGSKSSGTAPTRDKNYGFLTDGSGHRVTKDGKDVTLPKDENGNVITKKSETSGTSGSKSSGTAPTRDKNYGFLTDGSGHRVTKDGKDVTLPRDENGNVITGGTTVTTGGKNSGSSITPQLIATLTLIHLSMKS